MTGLARFSCFHDYSAPSDLEFDITMELRISAIESLRATSFVAIVLAFHLFMQGVSADCYNRNSKSKALRLRIDGRCS